MEDDSNEVIVNLIMFYMLMKDIIMRNLDNAIVITISGSTWYLRS